jgi:hypothetical protein
MPLRAGLGGIGIGSKRTEIMVPAIRMGWESRGPGRLTAPGGPERTGQLPVNTGLSAGRPVVPLWLAPATRT